MEGGLIQPRLEGTPQGGPLSPLLSNILLTELDRELEKRGHSFCRFADESNVYFKGKSAVERPWNRKFLGYSVTAHRNNKLKIAATSLNRLMAKIRELRRMGRGRTIANLNPLLRG